MKKTVIAGLMISLLGGCSVLQELQRGPDSSYVTPEIVPSEIDKIASDIATSLSRQLPPAKTTLAFKPEVTLFHEVFLDELSSRGYGIATGESPVDAIPVQYYVTMLDGGILVRISFKDQVTSRYYRRTEKGLSFGNIAIRGVTK